MKNLFILALAFSAAQSSYASKMIKETIYTGKLDQTTLNKSLLVSKFYEVKLNDDKSPSFVYGLRPELKNEVFKAGYYKATAFTLISSISSKMAMSLKSEFKKMGEFKIEGETISFEGDLSIDQTKIGNVKYEFNMYDLPIRRVYNPKVTRSMESTETGFIIVENREIAD